MGKNIEKLPPGSVFVNILTTTEKGFRKAAGGNRLRQRKSEPGPDGATTLMLRGGEVGRKVHVYSRVPERAGLSREGKGVPGQ